MIVLDTSALMAVALDEPGAAECFDVLRSEDELLISASTLTETLIVSGKRGLDAHIGDLLARLAVTVVPVFEADARQAAEAHARWGKGVHSAGLNFGDCFSYALAKQRNCPLLYVGNDFAQTDIASAIA